MDSHGILDQSGDLSAVGVFRAYCPGYFAPYGYPGRKTQNLHGGRRAGFSH